MAISITVAEVKDKLLIPSATTTYDTPIDSLIDLMQPALETELEPTLLANASLASVIKQGMLEVIAGEFLNQRRREPGYAEDITVGTLKIGASALDGSALILQGRERLLPFLSGSLDGGTISCPDEVTFDPEVEW